MACTICATGTQDLGSGTNEEIGRRFGVTESSVRRHKAHGGQTPDSDFPDIPVGLMTSRGKSVRKIDGSWEKVTWQPNAKAIHDTLAYDDLERALEGFVPEKVSGRTTSAASTLHAADAQIGKANQRGGGTPESLIRMRQSFQTYAEYLRATRPGQVVLSDNGDPIENVFNVATQLCTNDLDVPAQIRVFRRLMIEGIKLLAPLTDEFTYLAVPSNHGAFRTGYKAQGGTTDADFGLEISHQLEDVCKEVPALQHVKFVRPEPLEETAVVTVGGTKIAYHHGHQSSGPTAHGKWWAGQDHGRRPGWDADMLVTAHYHSLRVEQSGDGRWIIGVSSSDPGSDWFTNGKGESARQGMTMFDVQDGQWSNLKIV